MPPPNLLFMYTDEQRYDTLACYGNTTIQMPNLNRLAEEATVFERTYVTQPVCTPSRSSLLTGLWPHTNGLTENNIPLRPETKCLPELLKPGVFSCGHHGKWHLGDEVFAQHGFEDWQATEDTYHVYYRPSRDQAERSAFHHWLVARGHKPSPRTDLPPDIASRFFRDQIARLPEEHSRPAFLGEQAARFIREHRSRPWVLFVNFLEPHMPFYSCRDNQYDPAKVIVPGNLDTDGRSLHTLRQKLSAARYRRRGFEAQKLGTEQGWRELIARYWGLCSLVDTHAGRMLDALRESGQYDNTIVLFTSDHGDLMGSHGLLGKGFMFEESARVPFLLKLPGQRKQRRVTCAVSQISIVPTLLDLMGQSIPSCLPGRSLRPLVEAPAKGGGEDIFIEWNRDVDRTRPPAPLPDFAAGLATPEQAHAAKCEEIRTVVTPDGWKFNWSTVGEHELFNLTEDPLELRNLAGEPAQQGRMRELARRIRGWQASTADTLTLPEL